MTGYAMGADDVLELLGALTEAGIDACVGGGWAVDALLQEQTRPHGDLDLWVPADQFDGLTVALSRSGVDRLDPCQGDRPWNFVLHDGRTRRVDLHVVERLADDALHYGGFLTGESFPGAALRDQGTIGGVPVRCETPEWSLACHLGYEPRPSDRLDVARLCDTFGLTVPPEYG